MHVKLFHICNIYRIMHVYIYIYKGEEGSQTPKLVDIKFVHLSQ